MDSSNEPLKNITTVKGALRHVGGLYSAATDAPLSPSAPISPDFHSHCELKSSFNDRHNKSSQSATIHDAQENDNKESPLKFCKFLVAEDVAGFLVGRKGAGIEEFQSRHGPGVRVTVSKRGDVFPVLYDRIATVVGISPKVHKALKEIIEVSVQRAMHKEAERRIDSYKRIIKPKGCFKLLVPESAIYYLFTPLADGSIPIDNIGRKTNTEILCSIQGGHLNSHLLNLNIKESVIQIIGLVNNICESVLSLVDLYQADASLPKFLAFNNKTMEALPDMTQFAPKTKYYTQPPPPPYVPKDLIKPKVMPCPDTLQNRTMNMGSCFMEYPQYNNKASHYEDYPLQPNSFEKCSKNAMPYCPQIPYRNAMYSPQNHMMHTNESSQYENIRSDVLNQAQHHKTRLLEQQLSHKQDKQLQNILKQLYSGLIEENQMSSMNAREHEGPSIYQPSRATMRHFQPSYTDENNNELQSQSEDFSESDQPINDNMQQLFDYLSSITGTKNITQDAYKYHNVESKIREQGPIKFNESTSKDLCESSLMNKKQLYNKYSSEEYTSGYRERPLRKRQSIVYTEIEVPSHYSTNDSEWSLITNLLHLASMANVSLKYGKGFNNQKSVSAISINGTSDQVESAMMMWKLLTQ